MREPKGPLSGGWRRRRGTGSVDQTTRGHYSRGTVVSRTRGAASDEQRAPVQERWAYTTKARALPERSRRRKRDLAVVPQVENRIARRGNLERFFVRLGEPNQARIGRRS